MRRCLLPVLVGTCFAGTCRAQLGQPNFILWSANSFEAFTSQFAPQLPAYSLWSNSVPNAVQVSAANTAGSAQGYIQDYANRNILFDGHITLFLLGYGEWDWDPSPPGQGIDGFHPCSFFDPLDALNPDANGNPQVDFPPGEQYVPNSKYGFKFYLQPWMNHARPRLAAWMDHFVTSYAGLTYVRHGGGNPVPLPAPNRVVLDVELDQDMCAPWTIGTTRILEAATTDPRWGTERVPGFGARTMEDLYQEAMLRYGWPPIPLYSLLHDTINPRWRDLPPDDEHLRKYFLWYNEVCHTAVDAVLNEVVYQPMKRQWGPNVKISNFNHIKVDGQEDEFGWYPRMDPPGPIISGQPVSYVPATRAIRAPISFGNPGQEDFWGDLVEPDGTRSYWLYERGDTSADLSHPQFYHFNHDAYEYRHNFYLPATHPEYFDNPDATDLRCERQQLESIINSFGGAGHGPEQISPVVNYPSAENATTPSFFCRELALFRSKDLREVQIFLAGLSDLPVSLIQTLYQQVYTPKLAGYAKWEGCITNTDTDPARLWFTLRNPGHETVDVHAASACGTSASILTYFSNLNAARVECGMLMLNLECSVTQQVLRGEVAVYTQDQNDVWDWRAIEIDDFQDDPFRFGFFAPVNPAGLYETRRTFAIPLRLIPNDSAVIRITLSHPYAEGPVFDAHFDLVQAFWDQTCLPEGRAATQSAGQPEGPSTRAQGADINHDGIVDIRDLELFNNYCANGVPAADFNFDGVVDSQDMADFLAAYGG